MTTAPTPLLTISAFARAVGLAPSTLRYYDDAGLLPPAEVDPQTGYRYYTPDLERRALLIGRLREVGAPVELMRSVLDGPVEEAAVLLRRFAADATRAAEAASAAVEDVIGRLPGADLAGPVGVQVDAGALAAALRRTLPAAETGEDSPLATVLLEVSGGGLDVVATDRYWLTCRSLAVGRAAGTIRSTPRTGSSLGEGRDRGDGLAVPARGGAGRDRHRHVAAAWRGDRRPGRVLQTGFPAHRMLLDGQPDRSRSCRRRIAPTCGRAHRRRRRALRDRRRPGVGHRPGRWRRRATAGDDRGRPVTLRFTVALLGKVLDSLHRRHRSADVRGPGPGGAVHLSRAGRRASSSRCRPSRPGMTRRRRPPPTGRC